MAHKYKLTEMSKTASPEQAAKELKRKPGEPFKIGQVTYSDDGTSKSTITSIDDETILQLYSIHLVAPYPR